MKLITPPNATPLAQSAAASGILPTEQTNEITASSGASAASSTTVQPPWPVRNAWLTTWPARGTR
jgi:hypothetical protein